VPNEAAGGGVVVAGADVGEVGGGVGVAADEAFVAGPEGGGGAAGVSVGEGFAAVGAYSAHNPTTYSDPTGLKPDNCAYYRDCTANGGTRNDCTGNSNDGNCATNPGTTNLGSSSEDSGTASTGSSSDNGGTNSGDGGGGGGGFLGWVKDKVGPVLHYGNSLARDPRGRCMIAFRPECRAGPSLQGTSRFGQGRTQRRHGLSDHVSVEVP
jgi:hypothetical protein